jgi:hypothetical protein
LGRSGFACLSECIAERTGVPALQSAAPVLGAVASKAQGSRADLLAQSPGDASAAAAQRHLCLVREMPVEQLRDPESA